MTRVVFMGSPGFAVPSLRALAAKFDVAAVYCAKPKRPRRDMREQKKPVHVAADALGLETRTPEIMDSEVAAEIESLAPDFLVVVAYGVILPQRILALPRKAAINAHGSLLPRWRGAAPIERAIAAGDSETGITTMLMEQKLDSGGMLKKSFLPIGDDDTAATIHDRLSELAAETLIETIDNFDSITPEKQNGDKVTWAEKITPTEAEIDFTQTAGIVLQRIRAFTPRPGAWFMADGMRIKVHGAKLINTNMEAGAGEVLPPHDGAPVIAVGGAGDGGAIALTRLQPEGKAIMDGAAFLNGYELPPRITKGG